MNSKKCRMCGKPATRVTHTYLLPNEHISIWSRFKRRNFKGLSAQKEYVCDECYWECQHGLATLTCKCSFSFKMDLGDFFCMNKIYCPKCRKKIEQEYFKRQL